jgi:drug/metabolite transporter (DMT)-like permease
MSKYFRSGISLRLSSGSWFGACILIGLGLIFLLQNYGYLHINNWWAVFILLGAFAAWGTTLRIWRHNDRKITAAVIGSFFTGLVIAAIALVFLCDVRINWNLHWPVFLIIAGVLILFRRIARIRD